jgi:hypothetical protein
MEGGMRVMMSQAGGAGRETGHIVSFGSLRRDQLAAVGEVMRLMDETEPDEPMTAAFGIERLTVMAEPYAGLVALAEALAAWTADGGPADRLTRS